MNLHPQQGIVVLEIKDWRLDTIVSANKMQVELLTDNPFEQVRGYICASACQDLRLSLGD